MWLNVFGTIVLLVILILLVAPWRILCHWSGGLVDIRIRFLGLSLSVWKRNVFERPEPRARERDTSEGTHRGDLLFEAVDRIQALINDRDILVRSGRVALRLARRFRGWWHLEKGMIELTVGLGNPAYTGLAVGALSACGGMIEARWPQVHVASYANFEMTTLHSRGEVIFRIRAWDPVRDFIRFLATLPWRGLWKMKKDCAYQ